MGSNPGCARLCIIRSIGRVVRVGAVGFSFRQHQRTSVARRPHRAARPERYGRSNMSDVVKAALILAIAALACVGVLVWHFSAGSQSVPGSTSQRYAMISAIPTHGVSWLLDTQSGRVWACYLGGDPNCVPVTISMRKASATAEPIPETPPNEFDSLFLKDAPSSEPQ